MLLVSGAFFSVQAGPLSGKPLTNVNDVFAAAGLSPVIKKDALLIIQDWKSSSDRRYQAIEISGDGKPVRTVSLKQDDREGTEQYLRQGLPIAVSRNYQTSTLPPAVVYPTRIPNTQSVSFRFTADQVSFDGSKPSTKTAATVKSWTLGKAILPDVNDFKGGIFAPGSSKEIFVAAETNNAGLTSDFRLDFFSMSGDVKSLKLETSVQYKSSKEAPNFMKIAVGNFTGSARKEVAVLSNHVDPWKFHLNVYSLEWYGGKLEVTNTVKDLEVYAHELENNYKTRDEWFFKAAGDIAMADFNGDGRDEIAVVYKGHNEGYTNSYAKDVHNIIGLFHIDVYKYSPQKNPRIEKASSETKNYNNIKELGKDVNGYTDMYTSIGDIKAAAADIDGDGKSELAVLVIKWEISFYKYLIGANDVTWGEWSSLLDIWSFSKSNLKPSFLKNAADFGTFYKNSAKDSKLNFSKASAPRTSLKYGTFTDQAFRIISGTFTGLVNTQAGRSCEDVAVSYSSYEGVRNGYNTLWVKLVTPKFTRKGELNGFSITTPC